MGEHGLQQDEGHSYVKWQCLKIQLSLMQPINQGSATEICVGAHMEGTYLGMGTGHRTAEDTLG